jgi:hypothetical protein
VSKRKPPSEDASHPHRRTETSVAVEGPAMAVPATHSGIREGPTPRKRAGSARRNEQSVKLAAFESFVQSPIAIGRAGLERG